MAAKFLRFIGAHIYCTFSPDRKYFGREVAAYPDFINCVFFPPGVGNSYLALFLVKNGFFFTRKCNSNEKIFFNSLVYSILMLLLILRINLR